MLVALVPPPAKTLDLIQDLIFRSFSLFLAKAMDIIQLTLAIVWLVHQRYKSTLSVPLSTLGGYDCHKQSRCVSGKGACICVVLQVINCNNTHTQRSVEVPG